MNVAIRWIYAVALGLLVVMTVGFGLVTFFPEPESPRFNEPPIARALEPGATPAPEAEAEQQRFFEEQQAAWEAHDAERREHRRTSLAILTAFALLFLGGGVVASRGLDVVRTGLMLGGLFTMVWGLIYAAGDAGSGTMFVAALLALLVLGALGVPAIRLRLQSALRLGSGDDVLGPSA